MAFHWKAESDEFKQDFLQCSVRFRVDSDAWWWGAPVGEKRYISNEDRSIWQYILQSKFSNNRILYTRQEFSLLPVLGVLWPNSQTKLVLLHTTEAKFASYSCKRDVLSTFPLCWKRGTLHNGEKNYCLLIQKEITLRQRAGILWLTRSTVGNLLADHKSWSISANLHPEISMAFSMNFANKSKKTGLHNLFQYAVLLNYRKCFRILNNVKLYCKIFTCPKFRRALWSGPRLTTATNGSLVSTPLKAISWPILSIINSPFREKPEVKRHTVKSQLLPLKHQPTKVELEYSLIVLSVISSIQPMMSPFCQILP